MAKSVCIYFQVHQPNRLKKYTFFELGHDHYYEDDNLNSEVLNKVSEKCYNPANNLMLKLIEKHGKKFKLSYSLSGVFIEQLEHHREDVLNSFIALSKTKNVEFLGETYYHSLAYEYSKKEFDRQVELHKEKIKTHFNQAPKIFRNTELIYSNKLAKDLESMGYKGVVAEGIDWLLHGKTPNVVFQAPNVKKIKTLLRNHKLSDDIAFRFEDTSWSEYPLNAHKFADWIENSEGDVVNLFMDYESIGEHHWDATGIFQFWESLVDELVRRKIAFLTPTEVVEKSKSNDIYDAHNTTSWADTERDLSAWNGNNMQKEALDMVYGIEKHIRKSKNPELVHVWSKLQTSDHFYYMCTKFFGDGMVHDYFSPYNSPYDGYIYFMNALSDLKVTLDKEGIDVYN